MTREKTREDVENLKENWLRDPCWDIEDTEGFEGYYDELLAFRLEKEAEWTAKQNEWKETEIAKMRQEAAEKYCPMRTAQCRADLCAWWGYGQCAVASIAIAIDGISRSDEENNTWKIWAV